MNPRTERVTEWLFFAIFLLLCSYLLVSDSPRPGSVTSRARAFTRPVEFNYEAWTLDAAWLKLQQSALGMADTIGRADRAQVVMESLRLTETILRAENQLNLLFANPNVKDKQSATARIRAQLDELNARQQAVAPLAESVIQAQVTQILAEQGLTLGGQPIPPVLYHVTPLPMNLVISPRERIEQAAAVSLQPWISLENQVKIEDAVAQELNVSTLVVPVGGIGTYPTMVMRTDYFTWQVGVIVHEWAHNFLTLRPLGYNYDNTPELRTMNETTASIVENEIGPLIFQRYYPTLVGSSADRGLVAWTPALLSRPARRDQTFDFRAEMHAMRVHVDEMLAAGKIEEAEAYMETRRQFLWDNGYAIRKLNQAYFAFYGAYADIPGGPAGEDPVGPAVRALRAQSASLADFLNTISWMSSFEQLQEAVGLVGDQ